MCIVCVFQLEIKYICPRLSYVSVSLYAPKVSYMNEAFTDAVQLMGHFEDENNKQVGMHFKEFNLSESEINCS